MPDSDYVRERNRICSAEVREATKNGGVTLAYRSMGEVAQMLGISRQSVHQLERSAMHKLRLGLLAEVQERNPALAALVMAKEKR